MKTAVLAASASCVPAISFLFESPAVENVRLLGWGVSLTANRPKLVILASVIGAEGVTVLEVNPPTAADLSDAPCPGELCPDELCPGPETAGCSGAGATFASCAARVVSDCAPWGGVTWFWRGSSTTKAAATATAAAEAAQRKPGVQNRLQFETGSAVWPWAASSGNCGRLRVTTSRHKVHTERCVTTLLRSAG